MTNFADIDGILFYIYSVKKQKTIEDSYISRFLVAVCDLLVMYICHLLTLSYIPDTYFAIGQNAHLLIMFIGYVAVISFYPPVLIRQEATGPQVVSRSLLTAISHFFVCTGIYAIAQFWMGERPFILFFWCVFACLLTAEHLLLRVLFKRLWSKSSYSRSVVLVGDAKGLAPITAEMMKDKSGYQIKGIFTNGSADEMLNGRPADGTTAEAKDFLAANPDVQSVYCQPESLSHQEASDLFNFCIQQNIDFFDIPQFAHTLQRRMETRAVGQLVSISTLDEPISYLPNRIIKRVADLILSILLLATLFPIAYIIVAIFIKRQSPGPIFIKKKFEGQNGQKFSGLLFRTKRTEAEAEEPLFPFGAFMQAHHLDELPFLFSILKGDVSFVGPRYHVHPDMSLYHSKTDDYQVCKLVKPGLSGCNSAGKEKDIASDIAYVQHWSIWFDAQLIFQTFAKILKKRTIINKSEQRMTTSTPAPEI